MKRLLTLIGLALCAGCSTTHFKSGDIEFTNYRFFWSTTDLSAQLPTSGGVMVVGLKSSKSDAAAINAMAQGFALGMAAYQGRAPIVQSVAPTYIPVPPASGSGLVTNNVNVP